MYINSVNCMQKLLNLLIKDISKEILLSVIINCMDCMLVEYGSAVKKSRNYDY